MDERKVWILESPRGNKGHWDQPLSSFAVNQHCQGSASLFQVLDQQQQGNAHQRQGSATVLNLSLANRAGGCLMLGPGESHGTIPRGLFYTTPPRKRGATVACSQGPLQTVTALGRSPSAALVDNPLQVS
jgi:hypothetical protein